MENVQKSIKFIYENVEKPCIPVLTAMERRGILVDKNMLGQLSQEFAVRIAEHEKKIHAIAGQVFNVNSPKQLGEVLFNKLGLEVKGKKKRSTNIAVLEQLAEQGHEIAGEIMAFRSLSKLRSTYTEALIAQINPKTGRVHTSYNQAGASTGRFSSSDPNLQNIPIRTEDGRKIRHAFIAEAGSVLLSADYSQMELRLLAHFSGSEALGRAFKEGRDIHAFTASQIFEVELEEVDSNQRRIAKILNFGLIYGMGANSVAKQIGVPRKEAQEYVDKFFARYDGVKEYMDSNKEFAKEHGYVETIMGRRIHLPDINNYNAGIKAGAERAAINAPLQGSNADIIKFVMPKIENALREKGFKAKMLLQVHDELIFEVPKEELDAVSALVKDLMENTTKLEVPIVVGIGYGSNWEDAH